MSFLNTIDLSPLEQFGKHTPRILRRQLIYQLVEQFIGIDNAGAIPVDREVNLNVCKPSIQRFHGALLFVDISGFTALSLRLSVEELKNHINSYFTTMLEIVDRHGGDVIKFAGDALFIVWETVQPSEKGLTPIPFEKAAQIALTKAVECGKEINATCGNHKVVLHNSPPAPTGILRMPSMFGLTGNSTSTSTNTSEAQGSPIASLTKMPSMFRMNAAHAPATESVAYLNVHSGVSMGLMAGIDIGADNRWEYFLIGEPLSKVAEAEGMASTGDMIICPESHDILHGKTEGPVSAIPVEKSSWMGSFFKSHFRKKDSPKAAKIVRNCGCTSLERGYCKIDMSIVKASPKKARSKDKRNNAVDDPRGENNENTKVLYRIEEDLDEVYDSMRPLFLREITKYEQIKATHHTQHHITSINEEGVKIQFMKWAKVCLMDEVARHVHTVARSEFTFKNMVRVGAFHTAVEQQHNVGLLTNTPLSFTKGSFDPQDSNTLSRSPTASPRLAPIPMRSTATPLSPTNSNNGEGSVRRTVRRPETANGERATTRRGSNEQLRGQNTVSELRSVTVMFVKIDLNQMELLDDTSKATKIGGEYRFLAKTVNENLADEFLLKRLQECIEALSTSLVSHGGQMRQFIVDDKGTVCIGTFGLRGSVSDDNAAAALNAANMIVLKLEALKLNCSIGVTVGKAYCGLVGSNNRHEYAVMGPSTNLSARLMGKAPPGGIICDIETQKRDRIHAFEKLADIKAKGYKEPVGTFKPVFVSHVNKSPLRRQDTLDSANTAAMHKHSESCDHSEVSEDNPVTDKKKTILNWVNSNFYLTIHSQVSKEIRLRGRKIELVKIFDFGFSSLVNDVSETSISQSVSASKNAASPSSVKAMPMFLTTQPARFIGIIGVQGVGKTALAYSITNRIASVASNTPSHNIHIFKTRFNSFQVGMPFNAWKPIIVDMLKRIYWNHETADSSKAKPALQRNQRKRNLVGVSYKVIDVIGGADLIKSHLPRNVQKFLPLLGYLAFHKEDKEAVDDLNLNEKQKVFHCAELLLAIIQTYPKLTKNLVVITIEDIHTFDAASLDLMSEVYDNTKGIVVLFTGRPQSALESSGSKGNLNRITNTVREFTQKLSEGNRYFSMELDNLDSGATYALVTDALKCFGITELNPDLLAKVYEVSGGNPFYAFEIAKSMSETKEVHIKAISSLHCIRIEEVICYRFDKLNYAAQTMLKMAAVACSHGAPFSLALMAYISVEDSLSPTGANYGSSGGSNVNAEGANFTLFDLNFATILLDIVKSESFIHVLKNNKVTGESTKLSEVDLSSITAEMIANNLYLFEFNIPLEQTTIYNLLLDDQKQVIHEEIAEYYKTKRHTDPSTHQQHWYAEEGFHWKRASVWANAMICLYEAAVLEPTESLKYDYIDSAFAMYTSLRESSITNPELKPKELRCKDLVTLFEAAFNYDQEKGETEKPKPGPNVMSLERIFQIFDGNSLHLKIGLEIHIVMAQKCMSKLQDPVVTKIFLEDAIQMLLLAKNPFLMSSTYVKQLMANMQSVYNHQLMSSMIPAAQNGDSKEADDGMHFYVYSFTSICLPLLSAYLQNDLYIVTKTNEGALKNVFLAEKFLSLARAETSTPVHTIQALCQLVHIQAKLCNFEKAFAAFEEIASLYNFEDHSAQLIAIYGTDRVPAAFSLVSQGLLLKEEMDEAGILTKISSELTKKLTHVSSLTVSFVRVASTLVRFGRYGEAHDLVNNLSQLLKQWGKNNKEHVLEKIVDIYAEWLMRRSKYSVYHTSGDASVFNGDLAEVDEIILSGAMISNSSKTLVDNLLAWHGRGLESVFADMCAMKIVVLAKDPEKRKELAAYCESACIYIEHSLTMTCSYSTELLFNKASTILVASHIIQTLQPLSDGLKYVQIISNGLAPSILNTLKSEAEANKYTFILNALKTLQDHLNVK